MGRLGRALTYPWSRVPPRPPPRLSVVRMLRQHRLRRGLLPVIRGRPREEQGGLVQPGPHEPPQQRGRQEGSVGPPPRWGRTDSARSPNAPCQAPPVGRGARREGRQVSRPHGGVRATHTRMCTQACVSIPPSHTQPPPLALHPCQDRGLDCDPVCHLNAYSSRFPEWLVQCSPVLPAPRTSAVTVSNDTALSMVPPPSTPSAPMPRTVSRTGPRSAEQLLWHTEGA